MNRDNPYGSDGLHIDDMFEEEYYSSIRCAGFGMTSDNDYTSSCKGCPYIEKNNKK
jgi:hypothetical protein